MTGVPHASDSTILKPKGSSKLIRWSSAKRPTQYPGPFRWSHGANVLYRVTVEEGLDPRIKVVLVLYDAGDHQLHARTLRHLDGFVHALLRMDSSEEQEILAVSFGKGEL